MQRPAPWGTSPARKLRALVVVSAVGFVATAVIAYGSHVSNENAPPPSAGAQADAARSLELAPDPDAAAVASGDAAAVASGAGAAKADAAYVTSGAKSAVDEAAEAARKAAQERAAKDAAKGVRPGNHALYAGWQFAVRVPGMLRHDPTAQEQKAAQLERSADVAAKQGTIVGRLKQADANAIAGWAYAWDDTAEPANVDIFVDGVLNATVAASDPRPGFTNDPSNPVGARAWSLPTPALLKDGDKHTIDAIGYKLDGTCRRELDGSPCPFGGQQFPQGQLLWVSSGMVYGWAVDPNQPTAPVSVQILGDGKELTTIQTLGAGQNAAVFQQALALSPQRKQIAVVNGTGADDPAVPPQIAQQAQAFAQAGHYSSTQPIANAQGNAGLAWDELDFFLAPPLPAPATGPMQETSGSTPLTGSGLAGIKFSQPGANVQAFLYTPPSALTCSWIQVLVTSADGTQKRQAAGSPMALVGSNTPLPTGAVTFVNGAQISGWAYQSNLLPSPIDVDVSIDGVFFQRLHADQAFAALPNAVTQLKEANHAFILDPPDSYKDGKTHTVQFFAVSQPDGVNPELQGSPATWVGNRNSPPTGFLDSCTLTTVAGWAYDPDAGSGATQVEIWIDGALSTTVPANAIRPDLVPIVAPEPTHGFQQDLPNTLGDGKYHIVRVYADNYPSGPKVELSGSPHEFNAQQPYFGINIDPSDPTGVHVSGVFPNTAAQAAGVIVDDVIRSYDGCTQKIDVPAFIAWAKTKEVGEQVVFTLWHDPAKTPQPGPGTPPDPGSPPLSAGERIVVVTVGSR